MSYVFWNLWLYKIERKRGDIFWNPQIFCQLSQSGWIFFGKLFFGKHLFFPNQKRENINLKPKMLLQASHSLSTCPNLLSPSLDNISFSKPRNWVLSNINVPDGHLHIFSFQWSSPLIQSSDYINFYTWVWPPPFPQYVKSHKFWWRTTSFFRRSWKVWFLNWTKQTQLYWSDAQTCNFCNSKFWK